MPGPRTVPGPRAVPGARAVSRASPVPQGHLSDQGHLQPVPPEEVQTVQAKEEVQDQMPMCVLMHRTTAFWAHSRCGEWGYFFSL